MVDCLLKFKARLKLPLPRGVDRERVARLSGPRRLHGKQFGRQVPHRPLSLLLGLGPASAADVAQLRTRLARAHVLAHQVRLSHRNVELGCLIVAGARGVFDHQAFLTTARSAGLPRRQRLEAPVNANAVLEVNHVVPEIEVGEIYLEGVAHRLRMMGLQAPRPRHFVAPVNLRVRDHDPAG